MKEVQTNKKVFKTARLSFKKKNVQNKIKR